MATNFLKYSGLTYDDIVQQVNDKINSDPRFANFRESAIAQTLVEIFAGTADIVNYYIERRAEECFFDTARLRSSVILLARSLGYDVQRAVPASAKLKFKLKGNLTNEVHSGSETIQIPFHTVFTYDDQKYILKQTLEISIGDYWDAIQTYGNNFDSGWITVDLKGEDIWVAQGEIKEKVINGDTNPQVGSKFQLYRIDDTEFSNIYGTADYDTPTTKVFVGNTKSDTTQYSIDRKSLINWETLENLQNGQPVKICAVRTSQTEGIEVIFGDARYAELGANVSGQGTQTSFDNIYIQYLATKGTKGNKVGLKDQKINFSGKIYTTETGQEVTSKIEFQFLTNPNGGADMETIEDIKVNAPNIYYSLDRLVSKRDYITYLKSLTSPINIKNALAWGEQEEIQAQNIEAIQALFNIVFFTCVASLYNINESPYSVKSIGNGLETSVLDFNYNPNEISDDSYFNIYAKTAIVRQLRSYDVSSTRWEMFSNEDATTQDAGLYDNNAKIITVVYTSNTTENAPTITATQDIPVDIASLKTTMTSDNDFLTDLAGVITAAIRPLKDLRGKASINANLASNGYAFSNDLVMTFDLSQQQFQLRQGEFDVCQIVALSGTLANTMGFGTSATGAFVRFSTTRELAENIITILNLLSERSQVTVNNIYVSPIIHNFELVGNIYLNPLFDRESERTKINDEIYKWLDTNADFNTDIYISNIIEIIEKYPSVKYTDIRLAPQPITGGPFYVTNNTPAIENYGWRDTSNKDVVYAKTINWLNSWNSSNFQSDTSGALEYNISSTHGNLPLQQYEFKWKKEQTTRKFFEYLAGGLYNDLKSFYNQEVKDFADSTNFNDLLSALWKDSIEQIRWNMLDTKGNIAQERDNQNNVIKGGYTIGSEIVKVDNKATYQYVTR